MYPLPLTTGRRRRWPGTHQNRPNPKNPHTTLKIPKTSEFFTREWEGGRKKTKIKIWQKREKRARGQRQKCGRIFAQIGQRKKAGKTRKRHEIGGCPNCTSEGVLKNGYMGVPCALSKTALPEGTPGQFHAVVCGCKSVTLPLFKL